MSNRLNSFFYDVTERLSKSTLCIAFDRKEHVDPELIRQLLGKDISPEETSTLQKVVDSLPNRKFLELSLG